MADNRDIRILLVEDDQEDAGLVVSLLEDDSAPRFLVTTRTTLTAALDELDNATPDAILLDLSLPDSQGFEGLRELGRRHRGVPVVVLTGLTDANAGLDALGLGAEDYLLKAGLNRELLVRALRYARERRALQCQIEELREQERRDREQAALERLLAPSRTAVTAHFYGANELAESAPQLFGELVTRYGQLLEAHFSDASRAGERAMSRELQVMSESLGLMYAGPRDVIRMHQEALRLYTATATDHLARAMSNEGRLMLVELMGYLVAWYRRQATGLTIQPPASAAPSAPRELAPGKER
ncbi:MAG: response regulator [bacterium]|nr:response regulator [bacterium]